MPFSFPASPSVGQQSTQNGRVYQWTGSAWELVSVSSNHTHTSSSITDFNSSVSGLVSGIYAPLTGKLNQFASTSSSELLGIINDETGSGLLVFNTNPSFSGIPTVPTAPTGTNTTQAASTAFVRNEISNLVNSAPSTLDTLNELAAALGNDANFSTTVTNNLAGKANLSGATFTGAISGPSGDFTSLRQNGVSVQTLLTNPVTGVGTSGYLSKWGGSNSVTSGIIFDNGNRIGINTAFPQAGFILDINGNTVHRGSFQLNSDIVEFNNSRYRLSSTANSNSYSWVCNGGGNFGVGFSAPSGRVAISGGVAIGSNYNVTPPTNGLLVQGNVGIGTTTPSGQLHVVGTGIVSSRLGVGITSPQYPLDVSGNANISGTLSVSGIPLGEIIDDEVAGLLVAGSGISLNYNDSSNQLILSSENYYGANRGIIEVSSVASSFNIPGGYTVGGFDLFLNGVKLVNDVDFIATNGNNISTAYPIPSGSVLEYISLTLANPLRIASDQYSAEISREIISVTGTLSTINIIGGYDSGGLDVYKDGLKLIKDIQYTANNGSSISLATPAASGSIIEYVSFLAGKARRSLNTITNSVTAGTIPQTDYIYVATTPNITVTMPSAVGNNNRYTIKNLSNGTINVVPQNGQTIDNQPTIAIINQYISIDLVSDNQNWIII